MAGVRQRRRQQTEMVKRGEVWLVALDPTLGSEIQIMRPCVIVSPPEMHDHLHTVLVAPMTTGSHPAGFRVGVRFQGKIGLILVDQMRALDKRRLVKALGKVSPATLRATLDVLRTTFME